jgi:hypothetical protein
MIETGSIPINTDNVFAALKELNITCLIDNHEDFKTVLKDQAKLLGNTHNNCIPVRCWTTYKNAVKYSSKERGGELTEKLLYATTVTTRKRGKYCVVKLKMLGWQPREYNIGNTKRNQQNSRE